MGMSCNGCRVLRRGCSENCSIRPCLEWIKSSESQAKATVFLAKFYGRAGLVNLLNAGPNHLRPAIFRSLLFDACGRIVNPIHGSAGLLSSGNWSLCQAAVDSVLQGIPITPIDSDSPPTCIKGVYDIRHVIKDEENNVSSAASDSKNKNRHRRKSSTRTRCKKSSLKLKAAKNEDDVAVAAAALVSLDDHQRVKLNHHASTSHDSSTLSHGGGGGDNTEQSMLSSQTAEAIELGFDVFKSDRDEFEIKPRDNENDDGELELELTLGFNPVPRPAESRRDEVIVGNRQVHFRCRGYLIAGLSGGEKGSQTSGKTGLESCISGPLVGHS